MNFKELPNRTKDFFSSTYKKSKDKISGFTSSVKNNIFRNKSKSETPQEESENNKPLTETRAEPTEQPPKETVEQIVINIKNEGFTKAQIYSINFFDVIANVFLISGIILLLMPGILTAIVTLFNNSFVQEITRPLKGMLISDEVRARIISDTIREQFMTKSLFITFGWFLLTRVILSLSTQESVYKIVAILLGAIETVISAFLFEKILILIIIELLVFLSWQFMIRQHILTIIKKIFYQALITTVLFASIIGSYFVLRLLNVDENRKIIEETFNLINVNITLL